MRKNRAGKAERRGILSIFVDFRESVPEEVTHELRKLKGVDVVIQMEMGRGVVGTGLFQGKKREAPCLEI